MRSSRKLKCNKLLGKWPDKNQTENVYRCKYRFLYGAPGAHGFRWLWFSARCAYELFAMCACIFHDDAQHGSLFLSHSLLKSFLNKYIHTDVNSWRSIRHRPQAEKYDLSANNCCQKFLNCEKKNRKRKFNMHIAGAKLLIESNSNYVHGM